MDLDVCAKAVTISTYLNHQKMTAMANQMRILNPATPSQMKSLS